VCLAGMDVQKREAGSRNRMNIVGVASMAAVTAQQLSNAVMQGRPHACLCPTSQHPLPPDPTTTHTWSTFSSFSSMPWLSSVTCSTSRISCISHHSMSQHTTTISVS
jgi:hypothetical protein